MKFVVEIQLDDDSVDRKVFDRYKEAEDRWWKASYISSEGKPQVRKSTGEKIYIERAVLFQTNTDDIYRAVDMVDQGKSEILKDSDQPTIDLSDLGLE